jgi:hypothetical protein
MVGTPPSCFALQPFVATASCRMRNIKALACMEQSSWLGRENGAEVMGLVIHHIHKDCNQNLKATWEWKEKR